MNKSETKNLLSKFKGYYNNQFFIDEDIINVWVEEMEPYDYDDALEHIKEYVKEFPDNAPRPHIFKRGLYTHEQKQQMKDCKYTVECNLCHRWMPFEEYERHYERCLDIQYLVNIAKQKGLNLTREELENQRNEVIVGLLNKYPPTKLTTMEEVNEIWS